jgi:hypothetical protein
MNMSMSNTRTIRAARRAAAELRQAAYDKLSLAEKLARLPKNGASKRELARLEAALTAKVAKPQETDVKAEEVVKKSYQKKAKD